MKSKTQNNKTSYKIAAAESKSTEESVLISVLENLPVGVVIFTTSKILFVNKEAIKIFKVQKTTLNTLSDLTIFDFLLPEYHSRAKINNKKILNGKEFHPTEFKIRNTRDEIIDVEVKSNVIFFNGTKAIQTIITDISDRVKTQKLLLEAKNDKEVILKGIDEVVYYVDYRNHTEIIKFVSGLVEDLLGFKQEVYKETFLNKTELLLKQVHPDDVDGLIKCIAIHKKKKTAQTYLYRFRNLKTNKYLWLQERMIPQFSESGKHIGRLGIIRDISEEVLKENQLIQSEKTFKLLSQNSSDIISLYSFDPIEKCTYVSDSVKTILGYEPDDFYKDPLFGKNIILDKHKRQTKSMSDFLGTKKLYDSPEKTIYRYSKKDGSVAWLETRYSCLRDHKGKIATLIGISRDITKEKNEELLRKETEEKFKLIAENVNDVVYFFTYLPKQKYLYINPAIKKVLGYSPNDFYKTPGLAYSTVINKKEYREFEAMLVKLQKDNSLKLLTGVFQYKTKSGKIIWVEDNYSPIFDDDGKVKYILGVSRDITREKNYRLELEKKWINYQNLLDTSPIGILIHEDGLCLYCNKTALDILGESDKGKVINKSVYRFFSKSQKSFVLKRINEVLEGKDLGSAFYKIKNVHRETLEIELKTTVVLFNGRRCLQTIISNISADKKLANETLRAELAEEANKKLVSEIEHRKEIQQELTKQTNKYEAIFNSTSHLIWSVDKALKITSFNKNYFNYIKRLFGYELSVGDFMGSIKSKNKENVHLDFWSEKYQNIFNGTAKKDLVDYFPIQNMDSNGKVYYREVFLHPITDTKGDIEEIAVIAHDVTDRELSQQKTLEQSAKLESIFESSEYLIWTVDMDFKLTSCNANFVQTFILNYEVEPVLNKRLHLHIPRKYQKNYVNYWYPLYKKVLNGNSLKFERKQLNAEGNVNYKEIYLNPIRNSSNEIVEIACLAHDITENKQFEKQIIEQSAKLKAIFESGDQLMWTVGRDKVLTSFNQNYAKSIYDLYGYYPVIGKSEESNKNAEYHLDWDQKYEIAFQGKQVEFISERTNINGKKIIRQMILYPIKDNDNHVLEISGIGFDITENKKNEERITQSLKEKEVLLKEVHHRVKNNMQVISSILNLQSSYVKDVYALNLLKECQNRIKSMAFIHESLYQTKNFEAVNFSEYITTLSKNLVHTYSINAKKVKLILTLDKLFLNLDASIPCGLIINEIISNSLKYAFPDNRDGIIFVTLKVKSNEVTIEAGDNGIGIPEHINIKQTETLGLQLVDTLVEQINGTLVLDRSKGTKFIIEFKN